MFGVYLSVRKYMDHFVIIHHNTETVLAFASRRVWYVFARVSVGLIQVREGEPDNGLPFSGDEEDPSNHCWKMNYQVNYGILRYVFCSLLVVRFSSATTTVAG